MNAMVLLLLLRDALPGVHATLRLTDERPARLVVGLVAEGKFYDAALDPTDLVSEEKDVAREIVRLYREHMAAVLPVGDAGREGGS